MQYVHALATRPVTTPVHGISKNNTFSGHTSIRPNYAAYLKYAFSAENSAGIIRQTLLTITQEVLPEDNNDPGTTQPPQARS